jgi:shikimate kinase
VPTDDRRSRSLWLIGLMGSGKSTVGRKVADATRRPYVDNDETIAGLAGCSTAELSRAGGPVLHEWEAIYVRHLADSQPDVVAGIPASAADRPTDLALLAATGILVYIRCTPATLVERVLADPPRPWLTDSREATTALIVSMFGARDEILTAAAQLTVDGERPVDQIVADVTGLRQAATAAASADEQPAGVES